MAGKGKGHSGKSGKSKHDKDHDEHDEKDHDEDDEHEDADEDDGDEDDGDEHDEHDEHEDDENSGSGNVAHPAADDDGLTTHTAEAWKYIGKGPYDDDQNVKLTITDDDDQQDWFGKEQGAKATGEVDGNSFQIYGGGAYKMSFSTPDGETVTETFMLTYLTGPGWYMVPDPDGSEFGEGCQIVQYHGWVETDGVDYDDYMCFVTGTPIATPFGTRAIEDLSAGDLVNTADHGPQPVLWTGDSALPVARQLLRPTERPVEIGAHALGPGRPSMPLQVSPNHRVLIEHWRAELYFGLRQALVPAQALVGWRGIRRTAPMAGIRYHHMVLPRHSLLKSAGTWSESFLPGPQSLRILSAPARRSLFAALPRLAADPSSYSQIARPCLTVRETRALLATPPVASPRHEPAKETLADTSGAPYLRVAGGRVLG